MQAYRCIPHSCTSTDLHTFCMQNLKFDVWIICSLPFFLWYIFFNIGETINQVPQFTCLISIFISGLHKPSWIKWVSHGDKTTQKCIQWRSEIFTVNYGSSVHCPYVSVNDISIIIGSLARTIPEIFMHTQVLFNFCLWVGCLLSKTSL